MDKQSNASEKTEKKNPIKSDPGRLKEKLSAEVEGSA